MPVPAMALTEMLGAPFEDHRTIQAWVDAVANSMRPVLEDELVRLEKDMQKEEEEMHTFQKENNIGFLKEDGNSAASYLSLLNRQMADLKTEFDLLHRLGYLRRLRAVT